MNEKNVVVINSLAKRKTEKKQRDRYKNAELKVKPHEWKKLNETKQCKTYVLWLRRGVFNLLDDFPIFVCVYSLDGRMLFFTVSKFLPLAMRYFGFSEWIILLYFQLAMLVVAFPNDSSILSTISRFKQHHWSQIDAHWPIKKSTATRHVIPIEKHDAKLHQNNCVWLDTFFSALRSTTSRKLFFTQMVFGCVALFWFMV